MTRVQDARVCVDAGVDWIGINFWSGSKRCVDEQQARALVAEVAGQARVVGVFVNAEPDHVTGMRDLCALDLLQFHGNEENATLVPFAGACIKAVSVSDESDIDKLGSWSAADYLLLDTPSEKYGGSGRVFDWSLAAKAVRGGNKIIVAGGLTHDNVAAAIAKVHPFAVDVASGVESSPGIKDADKVKRFVAAARKAQ